VTAKEAPGMTARTIIETAFVRRVGNVPQHGLGLSVDVYSPDLADLREALEQRHLSPGYLEIFRAASTALEAVRRQTPDGVLTYHGEGLWLTQPGAKEDALFKEEVLQVAGHLALLQSAWMNHECATKHMAGYTFGTYLPPLYTKSSAEIVADNACYVQDLLDQHSRLVKGGSPLVLLELPPLTYFVAGTLSIPTFFRLVTEQSPCGLVLDIGHLWTIYRYAGAWRTRTLREFVDEFLDEFPVDRVVEIHVAGLANHESSLAAGSKQKPREAGALPLWTDAHGASIPSVLFELLDQVLSHPKLTNLRGLALEVDTKPVALIVEEFERFSQRYAPVFPLCAENTVARDAAWVKEKPESKAAPSRATLAAVGEAYECYAQVLSGQAEPKGGLEWSISPACGDELEIYRTVYLPYEILHWGGDVEAMFPETCRRLAERGMALEGFVSFWFRQPRPLSRSYDFFLLKIERFLEFIHDGAAEFDEIAGREADELRQAYDVANEPMTPAPIN
jgi:uncharacterized protein